MKIQHIIYHLIMVSGLFLASCGGTEKPATEEKAKPKDPGTIVSLTADQERNAGLDTGRATLRSVDSTMKVSGHIDVPPQNLVSISFPMGGYLKSTNLLAGMHISKGETIATMEDQQYIQLQQDYLIAKARLVYADKEYQRQRDLNQSKASSDKVYQQAQTEYQSQKVAVSALAQKLRLIGFNPEKLSDDNISRQVAVRSPINGFVSKVNVNIGRYVNPTDVLFEIVDPSDIHLALDVFEKDVTRLKIGQEVVASTTGQPDKKYLAKIVLIGKDLSGDRKTEVHCHLEKYDPTLIPGTYMSAEIAVHSDHGLSVPEAAIVHFENKDYVFKVMSTHRYQLQEVQTGVTRDGLVQLLDDRVEGETIVIRGAYNLLMKLKNTGEEE